MILLSQLPLWLNIDLVLQFVIAAIMFSVGLSLKKDNFKYVLQNKHIVFLGLVIKMLLIPVLSFWFLSTTSLSKEWQFGILLLLFCPGGTTSNLITYWVGGTSALTISLTVLTGFISMITLPFFVNEAGLFYFGNSTIVSLPVLSTIGQIVLLILLPTFLGLLINEKKKDWALALERVIKPSSVVLLAAVYLAKLLFPPASASSSILSLDLIGSLLPPLFFINIGGMFLAYWLSKKTGLTNKVNMTIGIEMGVQNVALCILVGDVFLGNPTFSQPALLYAMFTFWTTLGFAFFIKKSVL